MTYTIYGLRLRGDKEVRYIGQTSKTPQSRIETHMAQARGRSCRLTEMRKWLLANEVEAVALATAATRLEANAKEREFAAAFVRLDHRLFNLWLVPADRRIGWTAAGYGYRAVRHRKSLGQRSMSGLAADAERGHGGVGGAGYADRQGVNQLTGSCLSPKNEAAQ